MLLAGADVVPEAEIRGFPLRIGAVLLAPRFGLPVILRIVQGRSLLAAAQRGERQQTKPKYFVVREERV
jgi:hypothetical protein